MKVENLDGPNEGFNDPAPVTPVGGNTGATLGSQRLKAFQYAADRWGERLDSKVEIQIGAEFNPLPCDASAAVLGSAGPNSVARDFVNAPVAGTWFVQALANSLFGQDTDPGERDIGAEFNSRIGAPGCLDGSGWYFGLDGNPPPEMIDFVTIVLHELGHGLGFLELVSLKTGAKFFDLNDAFMRLIENRGTERLYPEMTDQERLIATTAPGDLQWTGENAIAAGEMLTRGKDQETGQIKLYTPEEPEPGSSVSHFSDKLAPHELMEPFYLGPNHNIELTVALFADIGWHVLAVQLCGNGVLDLGESCDDGERADGDGCDRECRVETCFSCEGEPSQCAPEPSCGLSLDHFNCHVAQIAKGAPLFTQRKITLADGSAVKSATLVRPSNLCTPADVDDAGIFDPTAHLACYQVREAAGQTNITTQTIQVANQFGSSQKVALSRLQSLCLPSMTDYTPSQLKLDAYACYQAQASPDSSLVSSHEVQLKDQFAIDAMMIGKPTNVCLPVEMGNTSVDPSAYLTCYQLKGSSKATVDGSRTVVVTNQFGARQALAVENSGVLCVPSIKVEP